MIKKMFFEKKNILIYPKYIKNISKKVKIEGIEVTPQIFFYELFIYDIIMGKKFGSINPVPSPDILIYRKYIEN